MKFFIEEQKGVAGVDEAAVATMVIEAEDEEAAMVLARDYHRMLAVADEVHNGAGRFNHYLMATEYDVLFGDIEDENQDGSQD